MYVFKEVSTGTVDALTEIKIIPMNINTNKKFTPVAVYVLFSAICYDSAELLGF